MKFRSRFVFAALISFLMLNCGANEAVQTAAGVALKDLTGLNLGKLYKIRSQATTPARREMVVQACVAGLYAIDDTKNARKIGEGLSGNDFVSSFMQKCSQCSGEGTTPRKCYKCKGTGDCPNSGCNGGRVVVPGFNGGREVKVCSICRGTAKCVKCDGSGEIPDTCSRCKGRKGSVNKEKASATCGNLLKALAVAGKESLEQENPKSSEGEGTDPIKNSAGRRNGLSNVDEVRIELEKAEKAEEKARLALERAQNRSRLARRDASTEKEARALEMARQKTRETRHAFEQAERTAKKEQEERTKALNAQKAEDFVLSGILDNESGKHPRFKAYEFDFKTYYDWIDKKNTSLQKDQIFRQLKEGGFQSVFYKDFVSCRLALVPDGLAFAVKDVDMRHINGQDVYTVGLKLLTYGKSFPGDWNNKWDEQPLQNDDVERYLDRMRLFPSHVTLVLVAKKRREAENWRKDTVIVSKGWVHDIRIVDAVRTFEDGSRVPVKTVEKAGPNLFWSMDERISLEL